MTRNIDERSGEIKTVSQENSRQPNAVRSPERGPVCNADIMDWSFLDDPDLPRRQYEHARWRRAKFLALAIVRGVMQHPYAFAFGMPGEGSEIDVIDASVTHRLSQLGYSDDEIAAALSWAYPIAAVDYDERAIVTYEAQWGHA